MINTAKLFVRIKSVKPSFDLLVVYGLFVLFMLTDFTVTAIYSAGDSSLEGNRLAVLLWDSLGIFRHFDYFVWPVYVFFITYFFNLFSKFVALWWVYGLTLAHAIGASTWFTFTYKSLIYDSFHKIFGWELIYGIPVTLIGMFLGLLCALAHTVVIKFTK